MSCKIFIMISTNGENTTRIGYDNAFKALSFEHIGNQVLYVADTKVRDIKIVPKPRIPKNTPSKNISALLKYKSMPAQQ